MVRLTNWLAAARLGMRWLQVMSALTERRGTRRLIWPILTEAALYICSSGEWSADTKSADELEVRDVVPVARARLQVPFHETPWTIDRWRCSRCQRFARNKLTLSALGKDGLCTTVWCCARGCSIHSESALVSQGSTFRTDHVVHYVRSLQLKPQLCAASMLPRNMSL